MRFCMECGHELEPGTRFCTNCGAPVEQSSASAPIAAPERREARYGGGASFHGATPTAPTSRPQPSPAPQATRAAAPTTPPVPNPPIGTPAPEPHRSAAPVPDVPVPGVLGTAGTPETPGTVATASHSNRMWIIITAAVAAVALVAGTAFVLVAKPDFLTGSTPQVQSQTADADASAKSGSSDSKTKSDAKKTPAKPDATSLSSITDRYSSTDVSVSAMFLGGDSSSSSSDSSDSSGVDYSASDIANTAAARTRFVSAGLYLPVYLAARSNGGDSLTAAQGMMSTMSNDDANRAIADFGGFDAVNQWLSGHGYADTTIGRNFGDVQASNAGYENYSSTYDAVRMLAAVDAAGASGLMNVDVAAEGVAIPTDMTIHAHRGQGIKDTWNYFAVVTTPHGKAAVALVTQNQGKATAAQIMSDVLADIDSQLSEADK